jgi:hypothetical protein
MYHTGTAHPKHQEQKQEYTVYYHIKISIQIW